MKKDLDYNKLLGDNNPLNKYPELTEATLDEFSKNRFEDASLNDIIKTSGMSKGSVYHHFGDKFGLYLCMMDILAKKKFTFIHQYLEQNMQSANFFDLITMLSRATMDFMFEDPRMHHMYNKVMDQDWDMLSKIIEFFPQYYKMGFDQQIKIAMQKGEIDSRFDTRFIAKTIEILLMNSHKFLERSSTPEDSIKLINQIMDLLKHGISKKEQD